MYNLRVLYERVGDGIVGGDMIRFADIPYRLKVYEYTIDGTVCLQGGVAYLTATDEALQLLSMDTNLVLELEDGERFSFEFSDLAFGKIVIKFKPRAES